ncbi:replicative helicase loader/inhibitor [Lactimicrobium sp.]|jgi:hypothetical protein|uniref:replicative helicase loader/inhibitor n=2 Tax=Lactimicrobium sp. TaxID=2563780 RepID=UPI002F35998A
MNKTETMKILMLIHSIYPPSSEIDASFEADVWTSLFPESFDVVLAATKHCLQTMHYCPKPADIRSAMYETSTEMLPEDEAWSIARRFWKSISSTRPSEIEEDWKLLPEEVKAIYKPMDMVELGFHRTVSDIENFERQRFHKAYEAMAATKKSKAMTARIGSDDVVLLSHDKPKEIE